MISINNKTKNILQGLFLLSLITITTSLVIKSFDMSMLSEVIKIIDYKYILVGFVLMILYVLLEGYIIQLIINCVNKSSLKFLGFKIGIIGLFYNLITPMASGSQPMQIYELSKSNIQTSKATAIVVNKTIIFQAVVTIYCAVFTLFNLDLLQNELNSIFIFVVFGMIMNIVSLGFGFFIVLNPTISKNFVASIFYSLSNISFLSFLENKICDAHDFIDEYNSSIKILLKDKRCFIKTLLLTALQLTIYFSVAFCISKALNLSNGSYIYILTLQVFLYMSVSSIPTPGNVGANEFAFFTIFSSVIPNALLGYSVFLYGIFVYYFLLVICGIFTILNNINNDLSISMSA